MSSEFDPLPPALLAGVATNVAQLESAVRTLASDLEAMTRSSKQDRRVFTTLMGVLLAFIMISLAISVQLRGVADSNHKTFAAIQDCVSPPSNTNKGLCYTAGKQQTGTAIKQLILSAIYTAECARSPLVRTDKQLEQCVLGKVNQVRH